MEAIGLFVEGQILKLAYIKRGKSRSAGPKILALDSVILPEPLEKEQSETSGQAENEDNGTNEDVFGLDQDNGQSSNENDMVVKREKKSNLECIVELLRKYPVGKANISLTLPESSINYTIFTNSGHLKGRKLKKELALRASMYDYEFDDIKPGEPHYIPREKDSFLLLKHTGSMPLLEYLVQAKPLLDRKMNISLVTTPEIALAHIPRFHDGTKNFESAMLVHIGSEFSRIIFLKNGVVDRVSPIISLDDYSEESLNKLYAKILFELDHNNVPQPERIFLSGEMDLDGLLAYFQAKFPDSHYSMLTSKVVLDTSLLETEQKTDTAPFAIPIGLTAGTFKKSNKAYAHTNFLPKSMKKEQSSSHLAWHGYCALLLLFFAALFYTYKWYHYSIQKEQTEFLITLADESLETERRITQKISSLEESIEHYRYYISLVDSLWYPGPLYSDALYFLSKAARDLNSVWIKRLTLNEKNFQLNGASLYRTRIHRMADITGNTVINYTEEEKVREGKIYNFELLGNPLDFVTPVFNNVALLDSANFDNLNTNNRTVLKTVNSYKQRK
ncbi:hypothetical protein AMJ80_10755 [bacterium SM23_31]|nr:MAG: hypothetical protein AMJ80_10755 [bacterium SM23_31]